MEGQGIQTGGRGEMRTFCQSRGIKIKYLCGDERRKEKKENVLRKRGVQKRQFIQIESKSC